MITSPVVRMLPAPSMAKAAASTTQTQTGGYNIGAAAVPSNPMDDVDMTLLVSRGGLQA
jgi:hypothetical protein